MRSPDDDPFVGASRKPQSIAIKGKKIPGNSRINLIVTSKNHFLK